MFGDEDAAKVTSLTEFDANVSKLKSIRIRQVTGGGSFSSGTKAKLRLSIPLKAKYVSSIQTTNEQTPQMTQVGGAWIWQDTATPRVTTNYQDMTISTMTMYHPSPLRIENVQHDAVLSLNDPSDPTADTVVLIPLKAANSGDESTDFFNKIGSFLTRISAPDPVTGLYPEIDIPTGNDWNIKKVFWLGQPGADNIAPVTDAYYTWMGASTYKRVQRSASATEIVFGWDPDGKQVRYFMLQTPVSISTTDLSFLTRSLPPTPSEEAIHRIPDPTTAGNAKILYKKAEGQAAAAACGTVVREGMANRGQGDILASLFSGGGVEDLLVGADGTPLSDKTKASCDPFAQNAQKATISAGPFTPTKMAAFFFNFLILIALAIGTWLALYFITDRDYDYRFKSFSEDAGRVIGKVVLQTQGRLGISFGKGKSESGEVAAPAAAEGAPSSSPADKAFGAFADKFKGLTSGFKLPGVKLPGMKVQ